MKLNSTPIEGSKLTDRQVEDLLGRLHITEFKTRDEQEVAGYAYVMSGATFTSRGFHGEMDHPD